jgi:type II secretory pathway predicted ATPase ExeA
MYETFFGLREKPFSLLPNPRYLYASRTHRLGLTLLRYGLAEQTGFVVLTGEVGTGKTTLLHHMLAVACEDRTVAMVGSTYPGQGELMRWVLLACGLDQPLADSPALHAAFTAFLRARHAEGRRVVLVVDEAQNLDAAALEQLRLLSNVNTGDDHLLQLVLAGQPELRALLQRPDLRQLVQRISVDHHLEPLSRADTTAYLRHRLTIAGGRPDLFDDEACAAIHWFGHGIPRLTNALADLTLVYAFADDLPRVSVDVVLEVALDRTTGGLTGLRRPEGDVTADRVRRLVSLINTES